jgi:hypothetical protein
LGNIASANRFPTIIPAARFDDRCISRIFVWAFSYGLCEQLCSGSIGDPGGYD